MRYNYNERYFTRGGSLSSSLQSTYPIQLHWMGCLVHHLDLDLSLTNIKGLPTLMPAQRHNSMAQQPTTLITFKFKIEDEGCASLQPWMHALTWLAGWLADVERCSCIKMDPTERKTTLFASKSASLLFVLSTWKKFDFCKDFSRTLILKISLAKRKSDGAELVTMDLMMACESPKTFSLLMPKSFRYLSPWKRAITSAWMLEVWPRP